MHSYNDDKTSHITCAHFTTPEAEVGFKAACRYVYIYMRCNKTRPVNILIE